MSFTEIKPFVTEEERKYLLSRMDEPDWFRWRNSRSGTLSPLHFKEIEFRGVYALIMKMLPNAKQPWHTDITQGSHARNTLILHPLTEDYAPFQAEEASSCNPIIADIQSRHAVFNNNNTRMNLQIPFTLDYVDAIKDNSEVWNLLNRFYKENDEQS